MRGCTEERGGGGLRVKQGPEGEGEMSQSLLEQVLAWTSTFPCVRFQERKKEGKKSTAAGLGLHIREHEEADKLIMDDDTAGLKYMEIITNGLVFKYCQQRERKAVSFTVYQAL